MTDHERLLWVWDRVNKDIWPYPQVADFVNKSVTTSDVVFRASARRYFKLEADTPLYLNGCGE